MSKKSSKFGTPLPLRLLTNSGWVPSEGTVALCGAYASKAIIFASALRFVYRPLFCPYMQAYGSNNRPINIEFYSIQRK